MQEEDEYGMRNKPRLERAPRQATAQPLQLWAGTA